MERPAILLSCPWCHECWKWANMGGSIKQLNVDADFSQLMNTYKKDLGTMQTDYHTEQSDASGGCSNSSQVGADASQVGADASEIGADDSQFQYQISSIKSDISTVQDFTQKIQNHWKDLGQQPFPGVGANDVSNALQSGNAAISQAKSNIQGAQSQVSSFDAQSAQIAKQAQALSDGMHC